MKIYLKGQGNAFAVIRGKNYDYCFQKGVGKCNGPFLSERRLFPTERLSASALKYDGKMALPRHLDLAYIREDERFHLVRMYDFFGDIFMAQKFLISGLGELEVFITENLWIASPIPTMTSSCIRTLEDHKEELERMLSLGYDENMKKKLNAIKRVLA